MTHEQKISRISRSLGGLDAGKRPKFRKSSPSHQVPKRRKAGDDDQVIDVSDLDEILEIDVEGRTCTAEPGLTFEALTRATLAHGLVPACVPELKTITIGGAVAGCSVESLSHKLGGFHDNCLEYEVLTARGEVLSCARDGDNAAIFEMVHGTFGTIGLITKLKFRLLPASPYVHLVFERYDSVDSFLAAIAGLVAKGGSTFIDALGISAGSFVLCIGEFVDEAPYLHSYEWMRAYHRSAAKRSEDYLTTREYFFRYDADCHWIGRNYGLENPLVRLLLGKFFLGSTRMLSLANALPFMIKADKPDVVVDVFVPFSRAKDFLEFYRREFDYWPLWIVPYRIAKPYPWISPDFIAPGSEELYLDFAVYGFKAPDSRNYFRLLEEELVRLKGIKTLISHNFYERGEFWKIWNREAYEGAKRLTDPEGLFGDLYDKTHRRA
jgi:FAD/FMN-containing dehydrogenase